jgi:integrase
MAKRALGQDLEDETRTWVPVSDNLVLHRPSGMFYVRKSRAGKGRLFKSTGISQKGRAQARADEMISEWLHGKRSATGKVQRVDQAVEQLEAHLEEEVRNGDRTEKTLEHDRTYLKLLKEWFGDMYLDEIDEDWWTDWVTNVGRKKGRTLFDVAKYLSKALTFAHRKKWIMRKPKIRNPDKKKRLGDPHIYAQAEILAIAEHADLEMKTQLSLGLLCGNRTKEVRTLELSMIEFKDHEGEMVAVITFPVDKAGAHRGEGRQFMAAPRVAALLKDWLRTRPVHSFRYVFPMITDPNRPQTSVYQNRKWRKLCRKAGIKGRGWFYDLRHTFYTTALLDAREPVQHVSEFGGTSIRTLQKRYLQSGAEKTASVSQAVKFDLGEEE